MLEIGFSIAIGAANKPGSQITTDPALNSIAANGWQADYTAPPTFDPEGAPKYLAVNRAGFSTSGSATTWFEAIPITKRVRQAFPNQASLTATTVALADYVYATDAVLGSPVNNSTVTSPKPIANWARPDRRIVGNTIPKEELEIVAFHRDARNGEQVACVEWIVSDGTTTLPSIKVSASVVSGASFDRQAVIVYRPASDVDISGLLNPANVTVQAKVYPWVGGAASVLDSSAQTADSREFCNRVFRRSTTLAASPYYVYVATGGNDTTGAVSTNAATAAATPCATIKGAIERARTIMPGNLCDGLIVRLQEATHALADLAVFTYTSNAEIIVEAAPGTVKANVILAYGTTANWQSQVKYLRFRNITLSRGGNFGLRTTNPGKLVFENCDHNGGASGFQINQSGTALHLLGGTFTNSTSAMLGAYTNEVRLIRGIDYGTLNAATPFEIEHYLVLGCLLRGARVMLHASRSQNNSIVAFNRFLGSGTTSVSLDTIMFGEGAEANATGIAIVQNVVEWTLGGATTNRGLRLSSDDRTTNLNHVVVHHNTFTGANDQGRWNIFYNETTGTPRTHTLMSVKGNIAPQLNCKHDVWHQDGTFVQSWAAAFGVGHASNHVMYLDAAGGVSTPGGGWFYQDYPGRWTRIGTSNSVRLDPIFTDYRSTTYNGTTYTAGAGNGDYHVAGNSPCKGMLREGLLRFDLDGTARPINGATAGAYS